jgi:radical SAM protein with 4Fe4S-binding SPASM domain
MEMASNLKKAGLDAILVTLISHRENVHDEFTGIPGSWKKTTAGIRELVKAGIETYSFTTVHRYNHEHCRAIYRFVKQELKAHSLFYQYIPQQKKDPLLISAREWHQIKHWILLEENVAHAGFVRDFYTISGNACSGGNFVLTVKVDGSVQPCPFIHNIPLGNIKKDSIWSIYRKRFNMPELVEFKSTPKECLACAYKSICGGGCKAGNDVYSGTYSCKDLRCLGPFAEVQSKEKVMADLPTFFSSLYNYGQQTHHRDKRNKQNIRTQKDTGSNQSDSSSREHHQHCGREWQWKDHPSEDYCGNAKTRGRFNPYLRHFWILPPGIPDLSQTHSQRESSVFCYGICIEKKKCRVEKGYGKAADLLPASSTSGYNSRKAEWRNPAETESDHRIASQPRPPDSG